MEISQGEAAYQLTRAKSKWKNTRRVILTLCFILAFTITISIEVTSIVTNKIKMVDSQNITISTETTINELTVQLHALLKLIMLKKKEITSQDAKNLFKFIKQIRSTLEKDY